jgi:hypothetical protein
MASIYTNLSGDELDTFNRFLKTEGLKPSAGLLRIFREWRRFVAGAPPPPRYSSISPEQLNLILGEAADIKRGLKRCELALLEPRPLLPEELAEWKSQQEAAQETFQRINRWQDGLTRTGMVIAIPSVELEDARRIALIAYKWTGPRASACQKLLWSLMALFIKIPERPAPPPEQSAMPPVAPTQSAPKS